MKYIFREDLAEKLPGILSLLRELAGKRDGLEYLETVITYLAKSTDRLTEKDLTGAAEAVIDSAGGELMATIAEKWIEKGKTEGKVEGKIEGKIEGLLDGIETGLNCRFGRKGLKLLPEIRRIKNPEILKALHKELWRAESPEDLRKIYRA